MTPQPQDYRILVVDDEIAVLEVMQDLLSAAGWRVDALSSPIEALARVKRARYDALVLDLYMAEMPGLLLHAKLKFLDRGLWERTVFVSGHLESDDLERTLSGSPRFVAKPFRAEALIGMVGMALPDVPRSVSAEPASARPGDTTGRS
jgi:CheY-like chemotaxis protein